MAKSRGASKGKGKENVTPLPVPDSLPAEKTISLPEGLRWKIKAFQETVERSKAVVKAAHAELLLRQAESQQANRDFQNVIDEMKAALESEVPEGYLLDQINPVEGVALCRRIPQTE